MEIPFSSCRITIKRVNREINVLQSSSKTFQYLQRAEQAPHALTTRRSELGIPLLSELSAILGDEGLTPAEIRLTTTMPASAIVFAWCGNSEVFGNPTTFRIPLRSSLIWAFPFGT